MNSHCIRKSITLRPLMFKSSWRDEFTLLHRKTLLQMLLLVSGGHVGAHPDGHQLVATGFQSIRTLILGNRLTAAKR